MTNHPVKKLPTVGDLGEQGILDVILPLLDSSKAALGPGDDAGALAVSGAEVIVSVDTLVQNQDFRLVWSSGFEHKAFDIGWKSIAQNVSDINAMGGVPTGAVISLSLPQNTTIQWVRDFAKGVTAAVEELGAQRLSIIGGDLGKASEISVTTTVFGECEFGKILRSGAKPGDRLAIAGRVGSAGAGLAILDSDIQWENWNRSVARIADSQCKPTPPLESGPRAAQAGASAMLDISDGLIRDASRMAKASAVNVNLKSAVLKKFASRLDPAAALLGVDPMSWILDGGEDFGLLATFPLDVSIPEEFTVIGEISAQVGRRALVKVDGHIVNGSRGFDHFPVAADR